MINKKNLNNTFKLSKILNFNNSLLFKLQQHHGFLANFVPNIVPKNALFVAYLMHDILYVTSTNISS